MLFGVLGGVLDGVLGGKMGNEYTTTYKYKESSLSCYSYGIDNKDKAGRSALDWAELKNHREVTQFLKTWHQQSLADVDPDLILQREKTFFVCVDGAVYSKDFAVKARAMRTVSLGPQPGLESETGLSIATSSVPMSEGISIVAVRVFYENYVKDTMNDCTTADILSLVKGITKADGSTGAGGLSYCQLLRRQTVATSTASAPSSDEVGAATVFISHAWKYNFYEFLLALEAKFKDQPWARLWIDIFCHNQHDELTSDEWITKFEQHIVRINKTVMIVFPWHNPIPFTRAWCLLEVFYNKKNDVSFEVYLDDEQRRQFLDLVRQDPGQAMLIFSRISTRQSTCWVLNDQLRIHSLIESSVGFDAVDKLVHEAIARALPADGSNAYNTTAAASGDPQRNPLVVPITNENKKHLVKWLQDKGLVEEKQVPEKIEVYECNVSFK
eukprot:gene25933-34532_t